MKYGAMIAGILLGLFALTYVGIFGSVVGGITTAFDNTQGENIKAFSIGLPILAIVGGAICGAQPQLGGILMLASAFGLYKFLGFNSVSEIFILSIGAAGVLGLISPASSKPHTSASLPQQKSGGATGVEFDRAKWNALLQYDKDISAAVESIRPLGAKWVDEFAISFLALNDKQYLPEIVAKITARAKTEAEENAVRTTRFEEQQKLARQQRELRAQGRREKIAHLLNLIWGTKQKKILTIATSSGALIVIGAIIWWQHYSMEERASLDPAEYCRMASDADNPISDVNYRGPHVTAEMMTATAAADGQQDLVVWRCMGRQVLACLEINTTACGKAPWADRDKWAQLLSNPDIIADCNQHPYQRCAGATHCILACSAGVPVIRENDYPVDARGFALNEWKSVPLQ